MNLQQSMQVTGVVGGIDAYLFILLLIMLFCGLLGGLANYFMSDRQGELTRREATKYAVLGVIAALTVPLFLNMISSNLLEAARTRPVDFFVLAGFCLFYVIASRRLFENAANKLFSQVEQVRAEVSTLKEKAAASAAAAAETASSLAVTTAAEPPAPVSTSPATAETADEEPVRETLTYNDVEILRALAEVHTVYGNLAGLTEKTGLARDLVSARLTMLKQMGIIETRINDKNILHWTVAAKGKQLLAEILSGQSERKSA